MLHYELSEKIIGAVMRVLNELKPKLDEKIYENALVLELGELGLSVEQQRRFDVHYKGQSVGLLVPDLIVDGKVIVDAKVVTTFNESHIAQMGHYRGQALIVDIQGSRRGSAEIDKIIDGKIIKNHG
jgi:GxxExxY protein